MNFGRIFPLLVVVLALIGLFYISKKQVSRFDIIGKTLIVGTNAEFPPFSFIQSGHIVGFDIDVIEEIAQRMDKHITFKNMSFAALEPELELGTIHIIAAGITPTEERAKHVLFTSPYVTGDSLVAVQSLSAAPIKNSNDLKGKVVTVNQGYTSDYYVSGLEQVEIIRLSSPLVSTGLVTIQGKQADVYIAPQSSLKPYFDAQKNSAYRITPLEGTTDSYALAVSQKYPDLYAMIQSTLNAMIKDGTLENLKKKWGL